jgi:hypothetical protein
VKFYFESWFSGIEGGNYDCVRDPFSAVLKMSILTLTEEEQFIYFSSATSEINIPGSASA